jgi:hypothetical protein
LQAPIALLREKSQRSGTYQQTEPLGWAGPSDLRGAAIHPTNRLSLAPDCITLGYTDLVELMTANTAGFADRIHWL